MDIETLRDLFRHQEWADNLILAAVRSHPGATEDADLRTRLHHIVGVQRGFLALVLERPFDIAAEMRVPETFDGIARRFDEAHADAIALLERLDADALTSPMQMPWIPGLSLQVGQGLLQAVMHSQHHRGQCGMRLRELGSTPPMVDYIIWLKHRQTSVVRA
jgi:uncharacterized damage-inducible protein DinB